MAIVRIEFATDNAAFTGDYETEVRKMLEWARVELLDWALTAGRAVKSDSNGNTVGKVTVE